MKVLGFLGQVTRGLLLALAWTLPATATVGNFASRDDVQAFIGDMKLRHDFDAAELAALFGGIHPLPTVLKAIAPPTDPGRRSWKAYRARFIESKRLKAGLGFWQRHRQTLHEATTRYGVPEEVIVAIIGIETLYGHNTGRFGTLAALATLAFDYPPRAELFRKELEELLLLAREQGRSPLDYRGSFAGALGLPQFLPSSARQWAVDFDGDGAIDLGASPADAIGSVARFLREHGWQTGEMVTTRIELAADGNPQSLLDEGIRPVRLPADMPAILSAGAVAKPAALIDLVTPATTTEYWLGYQNFYVLTRYNRSSFYAMTVHQFAEALKVAYQQDIADAGSRTTAQKVGGSRTAATQQPHHSKAKAARPCRARRATGGGATHRAPRSVSGGCVRA